MTRALALVLALVATDALAQRVGGRVTDGSGAPVPGATVQLVSASDTVWTAADANGRYLLRGGGAGTYRLVVTAVGYGPAEGGPYALAAGAAQVVEVELPEATTRMANVDIDALTAMEREDPLERNGFYARRNRGQGRFFDRQDIEDRQPREVTDLFTQLPGFTVIPGEGDVRLTSIGTVATAIPRSAGVATTSDRGGAMTGEPRASRTGGGAGGESGLECRPTIVVDDMVVRSSGMSQAQEPSATAQASTGHYNATLSGELTSVAFNLDAALRVEEIEAIEAYPRAGAPAQYGGTRSPCGVVIIWTRYYMSGR